MPVANPDESLTAELPSAGLGLPPTDAWLAATVVKPRSSSVWIIVVLPEDADGTIALRLLHAGLVPHSQEPRVFVRKTVTSPRPVAHMIEALVGGRARSTLRMAVIAGDDEPSLSQVHAELEDLSRATARLRGQWLMPLLISQRVYASLMPIFDGRGEVFAEEGLARAELSLDEIVSGAPLFEAARDLELVTHLDALLRADAFAAFARAYPFEKPALFVRATTEALRETETLLASFADLSREHAIPMETAVLEIGERSVTEPSAIAATVTAVRKSGMRVSLGGLTPGPRAEQLLAELRPDFAKLHGPCVRAAGRATSSSERERAYADLQSVVDAGVASGATVIAAGVESPEDLQAAQAIGASLFCGFLLCRPRRL